MKLYYVKYQDDKGNLKQSQTHSDFAKAFDEYVKILSEYSKAGEYRRLHGLYRTTKICTIIK